MHNAHDTQLTLPAGIGPYGCCWGTWQVLIMPYVELNTAYDRYENWGGSASVYGDGPAPQNGSTFPRYSEAPNTTYVTGKRYKAFTCPSDSPNAPTGGITNHNYAVNFGNTTTTQVTYPGTTGTFQGAPFGVAKSNKPGERMRGLGFATISDGLSNTMLAAEVMQGQGVDLRGFTWWSEAASFTAYESPNSTVPDRFSGSCNNQPLQKRPCAASDSTNPSRMSSRSQHPAGVQVVMCDGSVRFVTSTIDLAIWRAMSTTQGGETFEVP